MIGFIKRLLFRSNGKDNPEFSDAYRWVVLRLTNEFPDCEVWGQAIQGGRGYGVFVKDFVKDGVSKSMFQCRSAITINGREATTDINKVTDKEDAIYNVIAHIRKSQKEARHAAEIKQRNEEAKLDKPSG